MASSKFKMTDPGQLAVLKGTIDLENESFLWVLVDNAHVPDVLTEATFADISVNECADTDYAPVAASGIIWTNPTGRAFKLDAADVDFGNTVTISARYLYLVRDADVNGTLVAGDLIVGFYDLNDGGAENVSSLNGNFDMVHNTSGLLSGTLTPAS